MKIKLLTCLFFAVFLSSCTSTSSRTCRNWMNQGDFFSTMDSCKKCYNTIGNNKEAVKGCAMGMDASELLGGY